jgi:hypothetical protein
MADAILAIRALASLFEQAFVARTIAWMAIMPTFAAPRPKYRRKNLRNLLIGLRSIRRPVFDMSYSRPRRNNPIAIASVAMACRPGRS